MSLGLQLQLKDDATPAFRRLTAGIQRPGVREAMGQAIGGKLRTHLRRLDRERRNKLGGRRTNFYGRAVKAVQKPVVLPNGVSVSINHQGLAQRYFGGDIEPVNKDWLTIPARAEAYGMPAGEFSDLKFVKFRSDLAALVQRDQSNLATREEDGGGIFYWLVKRVHQEADPSVIPTDQELTAAAVAAGSGQLDTLINRGKA